MTPAGIAAVNTAGKRLVAVWRAERDKRRAARLNLLLVARQEAKLVGDREAAYDIKRRLNAEFSAFDARRIVRYEPGQAEQVTAAARQALALLIVAGQ